MSSSGIWMVLFERNHRPPIATALERTVAAYGCNVEMLSDENFVVTINDKLTGRSVSITGSLNLSPSVLDESEEFADDYAIGTPIYDAIVRCDARWELMFDLRDSDETYNVLLGIAESMHDMCGAIVFAASEGRLLDL